MTLAAPSIGNYQLQGHLEDIAQKIGNRFPAATPTSSQDLHACNPCNESLSKPRDIGSIDYEVDGGTETTVSCDGVVCPTLELDRCRNPEPESDFGENVDDSTSTQETAVTVCAPMRNAADNSRAPFLATESTVRISPIHPKALRPNACAIMGEEESKRRKEAQVDFPTTVQTPMNSKNTSGAGVHPTPHQNVPSQQQKHHHRQQQQHQHQQHLSRASPTMSHSSLSSRGKLSVSGGGMVSMNDQSDSVPIIHPTPMFQRLVSDGVQELKAYARIIENQNRKLAELEAGHRDLELRLEAQASRGLELEATLEDRERIWMGQIRELEKDRDQWKELVSAERTKNAALMDHLVRKDQDIQRMLQRKVIVFPVKCLCLSEVDHNETHLLVFVIIQYDGPISGSIRNARHHTNKSPTITNGHDHAPNSSSHDLQSKHRSPLDFLTANGASEEVRERHVSDALADFFGVM